jgi:hypothetical protein
MSRDLQTYQVYIYIFFKDNKSLVYLLLWQGITWSDKVRELIAVKVLPTSLLNTTVVAFKVLPLGSYTPMPAPIPTFKIILEPVLWNGLQSCHCITPGIINVIKMPSFQYFLYLQEQKKKSLGARSGE